MKIPASRKASQQLLGILAATCTCAPLAAQSTDDQGPRYTYLDLGYQWLDVSYAVKQEGGSHEGFRTNGSLGIVQYDAFGLHLFGEYFNGDLTGVPGACPGDRDSSAYAAGLGVSWGFREKIDFIGRAGFVNVEIELPDAECNLQSVDDSGYLVEGLVRSALSDRVEFEGGIRYSDLTGIGHTDLFLGLGYQVTDYLSLRARGVVFDNDTGFELSARFYFGPFLARDFLF